MSQDPTTDILITLLYLFGLLHLISYLGSVDDNASLLNADFLDLDTVIPKLVEVNF